MIEPKRSWFPQRGLSRATGPTAEAALDRSDASALADLQMHWDEAYEIGLDGDIWSARFRGSTDQLRAHTSQELRQLIRTDYTYRHHTGATRGSDSSAAADADGASDGPLASGSNELDDDDPYSAHYDNGTDDDAPAPSTRANFAGIRGERMST
jgi:hypothetical protein